MFTNWLTGTGGPSSANPSSAPAANPPPSHPTHTIHGKTSTSAAPPASQHPSVAATNAPNILQHPPDVILEVGPAGAAAAPMRFVAHSLVLAMHSGYLRSAIRMDEAGGGGGSVCTANGDMVLYLSNVTAEQFAPLLTYMYTGYLDLTVENIFGVLLATHVLHMPRALEICRSFLARAQTEGYFNMNLGAVGGMVAVDSPKVIRPIASKAMMPHFGFLPPPPPPPPPPPQPAQNPNYNNFQASSYHQLKSKEDLPPQPPVDIDRCSLKSLTPKVVDDDEDEEVFIDSNTETDTEHDDRIVFSMERRPETRPRSVAARGCFPTDDEDDDDDDREIIVTLESHHHGRKERSGKERSAKDHSAKERSAKERSGKDKEKPKKVGGGATSSRRAHETRRDKRSKGRSKAGCSTSGLQIAKAPIPASQLEPNEGSKVIIDVASCDGPVRFRRILNTAYGHKPDGSYGGAAAAALGPTGNGGTAVFAERSQQSLSHSFHQQMAKNISQQRQQQQAEESENSESSQGAGGGGSSSGGHVTKTSSSSAKGQASEIYVCVYCKHTFKSQYCYQKHAKRHLNPLCLNAVPAAAALAAPADADESTPKTTKAFGRGGGGGGAVASPSSKREATCELLRREVRPLDMNVQYYPCKTCGSKFPSYYFVHKHRKMCHADEEADSGGVATRTANGASADAAGSDGVEANEEADDKKQQ